MLHACMPSFHTFTWEFFLFERIETIEWNHENDLQLIKISGIISQVLCCSFQEVSISLHELQTLGEQLKKASICMQQKGNVISFLLLAFATSICNIYPVKHLEHFHLLLGGNNVNIFNVCMHVYVDISTLYISQFVRGFQAVLQASLPHCCHHLSHPCEVAHTNRHICRQIQTHRY